MKEKEGKRGKKKIIRSQETTRTHALHLLENEFNKMLRDFYIHRLLISHFFFSCILRFPKPRSRFFLLSHSYFFSTPYFAFFSHFNFNFLKNVF